MFSHNFEYWRKALASYIKSLPPRWRDIVRPWSENWYRSEDNWRKNIADFKAHASSRMNEIEEPVRISAYSTAEKEAGEGITAAMDSFSNAVDEAYNASIAKMSEVSDTIYESAESSFADMGALAVNVWDEIKNAYTKSEDYLGNLYGSTMQNVESLYNSAATSLNEIKLGIDDQLDAVFGLVSSRLTNTYVKVIDEIEEVTASNLAGMQSLYNSVEAAASENIESAADALGDSVKSFSKKSDQIAGGLSSLTAVLSNDINPYMAAFAAASNATLGFVDTEENVEAAKKVAGEGKTLFERLVDPEDNLIDTLMSMGSDPEGTGVMGWLSHFIILLGSTVPHLGQTLNILNVGKTTRALQEVNKLVPVREFSTSEAAALASRGLLSIPEANNAALMDGFDNNHMEKLIAGSEQTLDIDRLREALNRGFIDKKRYTEGLERAGVRETDIPILDALRDVLPPLQDIIPMSVREVFDKALADKFELFSDFPEEFGKYAKQQGLSLEWSRRYWAAHWRLPSMNQGYTMFHRGVIDRDVLDMLIRAQDTSPFWRDKLVHIAYQPITRVDIRRMFKLGNIDLAEVTKRHQDVGYSPEDALLMTDFVKSYVGVDEDEDDIDPRYITMSQAKRLWRLGTITYNEAVDILILAEYSSSAAQLLVTSWVNEEDIAFREALMARYIKRAIRENLSDQGIETLFVPLELTDKEMTRAKQLIEIERTEYDSFPTVSVIKTMVLEGAISFEKWFDTMRLHGYADDWIEAYRKIYKIEEN